MKRCILEAPGRLRLEHVDDPTPGRGDLVIRVEAALTCGTDLKAFRRGHPKMPCPTPFGHEFSGEVVALGKDVDGFAVGDALMAANTGPCNECFYCQRGQQNLCESAMDEMVLGAYGELLRIPARVLASNAFVKPQALSWEHAALLEPLSSVCFALAHLGKQDLRNDSTAVVIGAGPIAILWLLAFRGAGVEQVVVAGRRPGRLTRARSMGAAGTVGENEDLAEVLNKISRGRGADVVVECTGSPDVWQTAPRHVRRGGALVLFGGCPPGSTVTLETYRLHYDGVRLFSPFHFRPRDVAAAKLLLAREDLPWGQLITSRATLDEVPELFERLGEDDGLKTVVLPQANDQPDDQTENRKAPSSL